VIVPARGSLPRPLISLAAVTPAQRLLLSVLLLDGVMVVGGVALAPEVLRSVAGPGRILADLVLFAVIGTAAIVGPLALGRFAEIADVCVWLGAAFALAYGIHLLLDFSGHAVGFSPFWFFVATGLVASGWATHRTRRFSRGIAAAAWALILGTAIWSVGLMAISYGFWHTRSGYAFWLGEGVASSLRHSGVNSFSGSVLQDMEGAVFFHPFLSLGVGLLCGSVGAACVQTARRLAARRPLGPWQHPLD
jgi:hypothetical protein